MYILFHTGMRISEFCGLTLKDIDLENRTVNIDHQLQRTSDMRYIIETKKMDAAGHPSFCFTAKRGSAPGRSSWPACSSG